MNSRNLKKLHYPKSALYLLFVYLFDKVGTGGAALPRALTSPASCFPLGAALLPPFADRPAELCPYGFAYRHCRGCRLSGLLST